MEHLQRGTRVHRINNVDDTGTVVGWDHDGDPIVRWDGDDDTAVYRSQVVVSGPTVCDELNASVGWADAVDVCNTLDIDPDMSVDELRKALAVWQRFVEADRMSNRRIGEIVCRGGYDASWLSHQHRVNGAVHILRWLIGGAS